MIELLVVIAIIGLLASVVLVSMKGAKEKARVAKTQQEIDAIVTAMHLFQDKYGELPPIGDNCSGCYNPCHNGWTIAMDALVNEGLIGRIDKDAWGNYYCYDDNDNICCGPTSILYSMGPNSQNDTYFGAVGGRWVGCLGNQMDGDDIGVRLPYGNEPCP